MQNTHNSSSKSPTRASVKTNSRPSRSASRPYGMARIAFSCQSRSPRHIKKRVRRKPGLTGKGSEEPLGAPEKGKLILHLDALTSIWVVGRRNEKIADDVLIDLRPWRRLHRLTKYKEGNTQAQEQHRSAPFLTVACHVVANRYHLRTIPQPETLVSFLKRICSYQK